MFPLTKARGRFLEWCVNGGMEIGNPPVGYTPLNSTLASVLDPRPASIGTKALKITTAAGEGIGTVFYDIDYHLELGKTYIIELWIKVSNGYGIFTVYSFSFGNQWGPSDAQAALTYQKCGYVFTCNETGIAHIVINAVGVDSEITIDDISVKEVLV